MYGAKHSLQGFGKNFAVRHQAPGIRHQAPGIRQQAPGTRHQAPGIRHQAPGTRHQASGIRRGRVLASRRRPVALHLRRCTAPVAANTVRHSAKQPRRTRRGRVPRPVCTAPSPLLPDLPPANVRLGRTGAQCAPLQPGRNCTAPSPLHRTRSGEHRSPQFFHSRSQS